MFEKLKNNVKNLKIIFSSASDGADDGTGDCNSKQNGRDWRKSQRIRQRGQSYWQKARIRRKVCQFLYAKKLLEVFLINLCQSESGKQSDRRRNEPSTMGSDGYRRNQLACCPLYFVLHLQKVFMVRNSTVWSYM